MNYVIKELCLVSEGDILCSVNQNIIYINVSKDMEGVALYNEMAAAIADSTLEDKEAAEATAVNYSMGKYCTAHPVNRLIEYAEDCCGVEPQAEEKFVLFLLFQPVKPLEPAEPVEPAPTKTGAPQESALVESYHW